jgi:thiamine kinase-like enzyme
VTAQSTAPPAPAMRSAASASDRAALDAALRRLPRFSSETWQVEPLAGGLTNRIYKVVPSAGAPVVARLSSGKSGLLAIDRLAECHNAEAAARAGVGPEIVLCEPGEGIAVVQWIDGRTFAEPDLDDSTTLARIAGTCRQLHAGPRFANEFDMFEVQRGYLDVVTRRGFRLPDRYRDFLSQVERLRCALAVRSGPTVPCHNDLLAANILDDGQRLWFIDYEYAGNNDPCFELGNLWSEANLADEQLDELMEAYDGELLRHRVARARLWGLMSKYGWTLWGSIQSSVSTIDFDFWEWAMEKYDRAVAEFDDPGFENLLEQATRDD